MKTVAIVGALLRIAAGCRKKPVAIPCPVSHAAPVLKAMRAPPGSCSVDLLLNDVALAVTALHL